MFRRDESTDLRICRRLPLLTQRIAAGLLLLLGSGASHGNPADPEALLAAMEAAMTRLGDYTVTQTKRERFGDRIAPEATMVVKQSRGRIYLHVLRGPRQGAEAIYAPGWNGGKVRIHKGSFPDVTLNLDPHGDLMMNGQHHPIEHATLGYVVATVLDNVRRSAVDRERGVRYVGETRVAGRHAHVVELAIPYRVRRHTVDKGEDAWSLARRYGVDPYLVVHANGRRSLDDFRKGQEVVVPLYSATRAVLALDDENHLPARLELYDAEGRLYEHYEWSQLDPSPLGDADFDPDNGFYAF